MPRLRKDVLSKELCGEENLVSWAGTVPGNIDAALVCTGSVRGARWWLEPQLISATPTPGAVGNCCGTSHPARSHASGHYGLLCAARWNNWKRCPRPLLPRAAPTSTACDGTGPTPNSQCLSRSLRSRSATPLRAFSRPPNGPFAPVPGRSDSARRNTTVHWRNLPEQPGNGLPDMRDGQLLVAWSEFLAARPILRRSFDRRFVRPIEWLLRTNPVCCPFRRRSQPVDFRCERPDFHASR